MKKVEEKVENQITKEELTKIQDQQKELNTLLRDIGYVETQKHLLFHKQALWPLLQKAVVQRARHLEG